MITHRSSVSGQSVSILAHYQNGDTKTDCFWSQSGYNLWLWILLFFSKIGRLRDLGHDSTFLDTASVRGPAINLYLKFGFVPDIRHEKDTQTWRILQKELSPGPLDNLDLDTINPL